MGWCLGDFASFRVVLEFWVFCFILTSGFVYCRCCFCCLLLIACGLWFWVCVFYGEVCVFLCVGFVFGGLDNFSWSEIVLDCWYLLFWVFLFG